MGDSGTAASPWDIPRTPGEGKPSREPDFRQCTWLCICLGGEVAGCVVMHQFTGCGQWPG